MKDISKIEDIRLLVDQFYASVRKDELLAPVFNNKIEDWEVHLEKMYRFWSTVLLGIKGYTGNPFSRHALLQIGPLHFERWLRIFKETVNSHFKGDVADEALYRAALMSSLFVAKMETGKHPIL